MHEERLEMKLFAGGKLKLFFPLGDDIIVFGDGRETHRCS